MFTVAVWNARFQDYFTVFCGTREDCDNWVKTCHMIGRRETYLIRPTSN